MIPENNNIIKEYLEQIKNEMQKFNYDFLKPSFTKWKSIKAKM